MFVSVIVPTRNELQHIRQCLQSVVGQDYPPDQYEIIVVDNGSTDGTVEAVEAFPVRVLPDVPGNVSQVRNTGAQAATGKVLAFLDGDCIAPTSWLRQAVATLQTQQAAATGCWYSLPDSPTWVQAAWDLQMEANRREGFVPWLPSSNFVIRRTAFEEVGGFEAGLITGEDSNICQKLSQRNLRIYSNLALGVKHLGEVATLGGFLRKEQWRGIGGAQRFIREFPHFVCDRTILFAMILLGSLAGLLISLLVAPHWAWGFFVLALALPVLLALQIMRRTKRWRLFFPLAVLYLAYGMARLLPLLNIRTWWGELKRRAAGSTPRPGPLS